MKTAVWKFPIVVTDRQTVHMPAGAQILTAPVQRGQLCLWALVNPTAPRQDRQIEVLGTGNPAPEASRCYIGTVQMAGALVWHVFEITATP